MWKKSIIHKLINFTATTKYNGNIQSHLFGKTWLNFAVVICFLLDPVQIPSYKKNGKIYFFVAALPGVEFKASLKAFMLLEEIPSCSHILSSSSFMMTFNFVYRYCHDIVNIRSQPRKAYFFLGGQYFEF